MVSYFKRRCTARIVRRLENRPFNVVLYAQATGIWATSMLVTSAAMFGMFGLMVFVLHWIQGPTPDLFERLMYYSCKIVVPGLLSLLSSMTITLEWITQIMAVHKRNQP